MSKTDFIISDGKSLRIIVFLPSSALIFRVVTSVVPFCFFTFSDSNSNKPSLKTSKTIII